MDVDHAAAKTRDHGGRHELQVPGEHHQVCVAQRRQQLSGIGRIAEHGGWYPRCARARERAGIVAVRDHARDAREWGILKGIEEGLQVRAAARHEHGDTNRSLPFNH